MKKLTKFSMLFASLALVMGAGLVGEDVKSVSAEESVYKTLSFPDDNQENNKVSSYYDTWTAKMGNDEYKIVNANNNSWKNDWTYIKFGNKSTDSVGSITTPMFANTISKVGLTYDKINYSSSLNGVTLQYSTDGESFTDIGTFAKVAFSTQYVEIPTQVENAYYRVVFDCKSAAKNGVVTISQLDFYTEQAIETVEVESITGTDIELFEGNTESIELTYAPASTTQKAVTYTSQNEAVATVDEDGVVTGVKAGSTTIKVASKDKPSVTTNINVTVVAKAVKQHAGTLEDPFSVADALLVAEETGSTATEEKYYIKGIVSAGSIDTNYGNATFQLVDTLEDEQVFTAFRFKDVDNEKFTDDSKIEVYDEIVVYASIIMYNDLVPETNYGQLVSVKSVAAESFINDWKAMRAANNDSLCEAILNHKEDVVALLARYKELGSYQKGLVDAAMDLNCTIGVSVAYANNVIHNGAKTDADLGLSSGVLIKTNNAKTSKAAVLAVSALVLLSFGGFVVLKKFRKAK